MVFPFSSILRYISSDDNQEVVRSSRKRKNSGSLDDVAADCLETPQVKRVRFSKTEDRIVRRPEVDSLSPMNRIASWVKMKANSFSHNFFSRPIPNGTEADHEQRMLMGRGSNGRRKLANNRRFESTSVQVNSDELSDRSTSRQQPQQQPRDTVAYMNLPSRVFHHRYYMREGSPILPAVKDRVSNWQSEHAMGLRGSAAVKIKPSPCKHSSIRYSTTYQRKSTVQECVRLDDRQRYQELLHQFSSGGSRQMNGPRPSGYDARKRSSLTERPSSSRKSDFEATKPPDQIVVSERSDSPICLDLTSSRSQSPFKNRPLSPLQTSSRVDATTTSSSRVSAVKERVGSSPFVDIAWVNEMKERFESSVRISRRKAEEQSEAYKHISKKKEQERQRAEEKAKALLEKESLTDDVEKEFPLLEPDLQPEEVQKEEVLAELTPEMEDEIDSALRPSPSGEELVRGFKLQLTRGDMQTLKGLNWLNDEVINFYFSLLEERSKNDENLPNVHTFNTFFYSKLTKDGYTSLRRWTKRVDIFSKDLLLVPVHLGVHWCLAIIDFRRKVIKYYDSMNGVNDKCLELLKDYLVSEHNDKKKSPYDVSDWELSHEKNIPVQLNGSDCGVFTCKFAEYATRDAAISFTQEDMPYFRRRMVWEMLHKKLL